MKSNIWEVVKGRDSTFNILHKGELLNSSIPDKWLEDQLARIIGNWDLAPQSPKTCSQDARLLCGILRLVMLVAIGNC